MKNKAYEYSEAVINKKVVAPKYVIKTCKEFKKIADGKDEKYILDDKKVKLVENLLKMLIMPKGLKAGQNLYQCSVGYQWLFYISILCVVYRDNPKRRRYENALLEIARKNFKTYTIATIFILLLMLEPNFSKFYSVAPDGSLSKEVREAIAETIKSSPLIYQYKSEKRWKILRDYIMFIPKETRFTPLNYTTSTFDGKLPSVFLADEVGALPNNSAIESMRSGQINVLNKLGCIISTKYPTIDNPFESEVKYAKRVLDGLEKDETLFALLYEPDNTKNWAKDDKILLQANPVSQEIPQIWEDLLKKRAYAISVESARENFITKHCNIVYQGQGTLNFIDVNEVRKCKVDNINWQDKVVYLGLDLAVTTDNTAVSMVSLDDDGKTILAKSWAFIPEGRIVEKNETEKIDYYRFIEKGNCFACGDKVIDYKFVEDFIIDLENKYGVKIQCVGYDRFNCLSTAQKLENAGYNTVEVKQHSMVLHPATKLLKEKILNKEFAYENNDLLEINFQNAKCTYDTNKNLYINKMKSNGKIDMVASMQNAIYLLQQDEILNQVDFVVQVV